MANQKLEPPLKMPIMMAKGAPLRLRGGAALLVGLAIFYAVTLEESPDELIKCAPPRH